MSNSFRHDQIYSFLVARNKATVEELSQFFHVTPTTIRRDLLVLEEDGLIIRTRGGAMVSTKIRRNPNYLLEEKRRIGMAALDFISPGMSVMLDSGSTILNFIECLLDSPTLISSLTFLTHSPQAAFRISEKYPVAMPGGTLIPQSDYLISYESESFYNNVNLDLAVLGSTGVCNCSGLTIGFPLQQTAKKAAAECADKRIALLDSTKYSHRGIYIFCDFKNLDALITVETEENKQQLDRISKLGTRIILA